MAHKIKNASPTVPHTYDETEDTYSPVSSLAPLPISVVDSTQYATIIDTTTTANTIYFGFVAVGSVGNTSSGIWRILRMVDSSGVLTFAFADGNTNFDNIWNNRASLTYS